MLAFLISRHTLYMVPVLGCSGDFFPRDIDNN